MARQEIRGQVLEVKDQIISCTACSLSEDQVPEPFSGPSVARLAVLGESPSVPVTEMLQDLLNAAGFNVADVAFLNVVSCPVKGRPSEESMEACRGNLKAQLNLIQPLYVILAGGVPLNVFKQNVKIARMHGRGFLIREKTLGYAIYHPNYVARKGGTDSTTGKLVLNELIEFRKKFYGKMPLDCVGDFGDTCVINDDSCVREGGEAWASYIEKDGTPWCSKEHWESGG